MATREGARRVTTTLSNDEYAQLEHWAKKHDVSINEYLHDCIIHMINWEVGDYDLPTTEARRLNQILDSLAIMTRNVQSLENVVVSGFDSLLGLTRGDNYLLDEDGSSEV